MVVCRCSAGWAGWYLLLLLVPGRSCSVHHAQVFAADTSTDPVKELELHVGAVNPVVDVELEAERLLTSSWRPSSWQPSSWPSVPSWPSQPSWRPSWRPSS